MTRPDPRTAADWRAIQSALLVDVVAFTALAQLTTEQVALPRLLAEDYAIRLARAYNEMASAAQDAADQAGLYAQDAPDEIPVLSRGEQLDEIMRDLDTTGMAWVAADYPHTGPEHEAREAVFARLRAWNLAGEQVSA